MINNKYIIKALYKCIFLKFNFIIMRVVWYIHVFYDRNFSSNSKYVFVDPGNQFIWFMIKKSIKIVIWYRLFKLYNFNPIAIFYFYRVFQNVETKVFYHLIWPGVTKKNYIFKHLNTNLCYCLQNRLLLSYTNIATLIQFFIYLL